MKIFVSEKPRSLTLWPSNIKGDLFYRPNECIRTYFHMDFYYRIVYNLQPKWHPVKGMYKSILMHSHKEQLE